MLSGIFIMGIIQGMGLSVLLYFIKKGDRLGNKLLSVLILLNTLSILGQYLVYSDRHLGFSIPFIITTGLPFLLGPFLYLYVNRRIEDTVDHIRPVKILLHSIPALCYYGLLTFVLLKEFNGDSTTFVIDATEETSKERFPLIGILKAVHILIYTVLSWRILGKNYNPQLIGLKYLIAIYLGLQACLWLSIILSIPEPDDIFSVLLVGYIYMIGYAGLVKPEYLFNLVKKIKYQGTSISSAESRSSFEKLEMYMKDQAPYLNPDLSLPALASDLSLTGHQLSQIINKQNQTNFSDYVNSYRVAKVIELLDSPKHQHLTLLGIAFDAGFNSKNVFNKSFKKVTGKTPSEFRKENS